MPTPAYIDTALYLPLGGINAFELNGYDVNGVGVVDSPFPAVFVLDPFRSILSPEIQYASLENTAASLLLYEDSTSLSPSEESVTQFSDVAYPASVAADSVYSQMESEQVPLADEIPHSSVVPFEYRTAYVLATHPAARASEPANSEMAETPPSEKLDEVTVSLVPKEYRTVTVQRGDS